MLVARRRRATRHSLHVRHHLVTRSLNIMLVARRSRPTATHNINITKSLDAVEHVAQRAKTKTHSITPSLDGVFVVVGRRCRPTANRRSSTTTSSLLDPVGLFLSRESRLPGGEWFVT